MGTRAEAGFSAEDEASETPPASNSVTPSGLKDTPDALTVTESFAIQPPTTNAGSNGSNNLGQQALDYIGTSRAIKNIFALPYNPDKSVSVGIHNVEGCLLVDVDPTFATEPAVKQSLLEEFQGQNETDAEFAASSSNGPDTGSETATSAIALPPSSISANNAQQSAALSAINAMLLEEGTNKNPGKENCSQLSLLNQNSSAEPKEYVHWDFHDIKMLVGSDALVYRSSPDASLAVRIEDAAEMREQLTLHEDMKRRGLFTPDYEFNKLQQAGKRSYADALRTRQLMAKEEEEKSDEERKQEHSASYSVPDLDQVRLQTCIVPSAGNTPFGGFFSTSSSEAPPLASRSSSPVCTVIDAYLDNIIANVPQLALCLREKGFIQSVKLLSTGELPSQFMHARTFDTSTPFEVVTDKSAKGNVPGDISDEHIFSPTVMDMNASTLLRFLKANCTKDNATYLLHREAGQTNIQLYDVSSISNQRQRKWLWWLATMSYRFALRLRHLSMDMANTTTAGNGVSSKEALALQRTFRVRSRSLLQNTLSLLEEFSDMEGPTHENFIAEVCEKIAESFLLHHEDEDSSATKHSESEVTPPKVPTPATSADPSQRLYSSVSADSLVKAQDYLARGVKTLWKAWEANKKETEDAVEGRVKKSRKERRRCQGTSRDQARDSEKKDVRVVSIHHDSSSSSEDDDNGNEAPDNFKRSLQLKSETMAIQLYSLHDTLINIGLRLAECHLNNYFSSSLMQALRTTARRMADAIGLFQPLEKSREETVEKHLILSRWKHTLQLQYTRLWELSGHFARSFSDDFLWRERGHAAGDDVISVLRDVEAAFPYSSQSLASTDSTHRSLLPPKVSVSESLFPPNFDWHSAGSIDKIDAETKGFDGDLTGIVSPDRNESHILGIMSQSDIDIAKAVLDAKKQLQRDRRRVLVAAALSYKRAIVVFEGCLVAQNAGMDDEVNHPSPKEDEVPARKAMGESSKTSPLLNLLRQRLGDACNEIGKVLLNELRSVLATAQTGDSEEAANESKRAAEPLLTSAEFWFLIGIQAFEGCRDLRNAALLRANACQCYKLRANSTFTTSTKVHPKSNPSSTEKPTHAELCLQEAANHLLAAHESLGERDVDPMTWDMISNELAATYLVLGVRRRQSLLGGGATQQLILHAVRLSPGQERSILSPMEKALTIYEQSGNVHQAAAVHYQLALFYSKIWTCQRDESKTREKLSAAFGHYKAAHAYFYNAIRGNEPTFIILSLDICSLYATVSGEECLKQALLRCLDTAGAFSKDSIDIYLSQDQKPQVRDEWVDKMKTLTTSVEERLFKTLRSLVKLEETSNQCMYKDVYRAALTAKMTATSAVAEEDYDDSVKSLLCLHQVLVSVQESYESLSREQTPTT